MTKNSLLAYSSIAALALVGCGSSNSGEALDAAPSTTPDAAVGPTLYGLTAGANCYTVTAIAPGFNDGCAIGVDTVVGQSLPMTYTQATGTVALGTDGSLGGGAIVNNQGTLNRVNDPTITGTTCTLHQTDDSALTLTADNQFTVSVTEVESSFSAGCGSLAPTAGTCTSTWTWTMEKSNVATLIPPLCGSTP
ncbi:MAG TPA: hypothetical protein VJ860_15510 [Polyangia bacterium]|jgi:hypothetical protein|nr:hypothetical protein [Polyangia bacterium]